MTTIKLKNGSGAPLAGDLVQGEPALDLTNKRLYTENSSGAVIEVGTNPTSLTTGGLTVDGDGSFTGNFEISGLSPKIFLNETDTTDVNTRIRNAGGGLQIQTVDNSDANPVTRFNIDHATGDISFYEDTGTTAKFFWDSSAESLGIGTSIPDAVLTSVNSGALTLDSNDGNHSGFGLLIEPSTITANTVNSAIGFAKSDGRKYAAIGMQTYADVDQNGLNFYVQSTASGSSAVLSEAMRIDSSGNVGIGTSSPSAKLDLGSSTGQKLLMYANSNIKYGMSIETSEYRMFAEDQADLTFGHMARSDGSTYSERMRIDSSGNVGIGTSSPQAKLDVSGVGNFSTGYNTFTGDGLHIQCAGTSGNGNYAGGISFSRISSDNNTRAAGIAAVQTETDPDRVGLAFLTHNSNTTANDLTEAMRIDSSGNLLVGSTSITGSGRLSVVPRTSGGTAINTQDSVNYTAIQFVHGAGQSGSISVTATSTSYLTSSDYRLKENVVPLTGATERLKQLPVHKFNFIANPDTTVDGFIAHEVQEVIPEAITGTKDGMRDEEYEVTPAVYEDVVIPAVLDEEGNEVEAERTEQQLVSEAVMGTRSVPDYQGIDQSKLVPLLVATIQELEARITALESN